jgi:hypothetical protein
VALLDLLEDGSGVGDKLIEIYRFAFALDRESAPSGGLPPL